MRDLMASRARPILRLLRRDERGAIGVLVAIFIGAGVLTGMGALVIDVGQLYQERAELQNGADAAALGVAKSCALGTCAAGSRSELRRRQCLPADRRVGRRRPGLRLRQPGGLPGPHGRED